MSKIQLLDQDLINKIAAGEVVERPASVVKELIENSLDAGASEVTIELEEGGIHVIRVSDNGHGMSAEDAEKSIEKHATSKIRKVEDLHALTTMGFRGEALAAISSVSDFLIRTREAGATGATEVKVENGQVVVSQGAGKTGTVIEVKGLFHSVPARKKFLKASSTEYRHVVDVVTAQAMLTPQVSWKLIHNGKTTLDFQSVKDWKDRVVQMLGKELGSNLIEINHQRATLKLTGFISHPSLSQANKKDQYLFVNGRPIRDHVLAKAIKDGYGTHLNAMQHPAFVVQIGIAPDLVDVNVHPRKSEVKFADTSGVYRELVVAVRSALENTSEVAFQSVAEIPKTSMSKPKMSYNLKTSSLSKSSAAPIVSTSSMFSGKPSISQKAFRNTLAEIPEQSISDSEEGVKLLGQIHDSYLVIETETGLMLLDQHAIAEKILYEELLTHLGEQKIQQLLVPVVIDLSAKQVSFVQEHHALLESLGVEGEFFGGNSFRLSGLPQELAVKDIKAFFMQLLDDLEHEGLGKATSLDDRKKRAAKYMACRGAVKFGDKLTKDEQLKLVRDMKEMQIMTCIHGRAAVFELSKEELNKKFHRC